MLFKLCQSAHAHGLDTLNFLSHYTHWESVRRQNMDKKGSIVYQAKTGAIELRGDLKQHSIFATQAEIAQIFDVNPQAITKHINNIYKENELSKKATCSKMEQVRLEGNRSIKRTLEYYNLDVLIAVGYRVNSVIGTKFRQWATKTLREHIVKGYTLNRNRIKKNHEEFLNSIEEVKKLLPPNAIIKNDTVLELVRLFADTWFSLDAYDRDQLITSGTTKKKVKLTAEKLTAALAELKQALIAKGEASNIFGIERTKESIAGIVGNVMQSFGEQDLYPTIEEKAAHLLYFVIKNHPFVDGNKRSGAYAFVWFLNQAKILDTTKMTPPALTALTLLIAESTAKDKDKMVSLVCTILRKTR